MRGRIKVNTNLVGHISIGGSSSGGGGNASDLCDHFRTPLKSEQPVFVTTSNVSSLVYGELALRNGSTAENVSGAKSIDNPSTFTNLVVNGESIYSLNSTYTDTVEVIDGVTRISRKCGHIVLDGTVTPSAVITSTGGKSAAGYFAIGWSKTKFIDPIKANASNIYCNRMGITTKTSLVTVAETAIYINDVQALYVVLPVGICNETVAAVTAWLTAHPIEIIYPLAMPYDLHKKSDDLSDLQNTVVFETLEANYVESGNWVRLEDSAFVTVTEAIGGTPPYTYGYQEQDRYYSENWNSSNDTPANVGERPGFGNPSELGAVKQAGIRVTDSTGNYRLKIFKIVTVNRI